MTSEQQTLEVDTYSQRTTSHDRTNRIDDSLTQPYTQYRRLKPQEVGVRWLSG